MAEKRTKLQDAIRASVRDKNKVGEGEDVRENTFVDSKTNRVVPDTERNRKRYGEDRVKATTAKGVEKKATGGRIGLKHGSYETVPPSKGFSEYVTKEKQKKIDEANKKANEKDKPGGLGPMGRAGNRKEAKSGGRINLKGGGCAKRGVKKNAYGKNS